MIGPPSERRTAYLVVGFLVAISAAGLFYGHVVIPRLAIIGPIALFVAALGNAATAAVLVETWRRSNRSPATFVLALLFAVSAFFAFFVLLTIPPLPGAPSVLPVTVQTGPWLYTLWHGAAALGGLTYIAFRQREPLEPMGRASTTLGAALAIFIAVASSAIVLTFGSSLPVLVAGGSLVAANSGGVGPIEVALLVVATALAFRLRSPTIIDRTLAVSLLALTLDVTVLLAGGPRNGAAFYASRLLLTFGSLFVFATALRALLRSISRLAEVEATLTQVAAQAAQRAERIRALWQMSSDSYSPKSTRFHEMLQIAAATIRPGKSMFGGLSHVEGDKVVVDATSWTAAQPAIDEFRKAVFPGAEFALKRSILSVLTEAGGSRAWDDLSAVEGTYISHELGWQSLIGTPVHIDGRTYVVTFGSPDLMTDEPYAADDVAFVEVVASFLAGLANRQTQFEQIQFDIEHDALTGLKNRLQFHKAVREEIEAGNAFALAFVNIDGFRHVNEREGHQIGDDLLCEVGALLKAVASGNAVARVGGDEFGILLRGVESAQSVSAASDRYGNVFARPFDVGVGATAQRLEVGGSIGVARFPADGESLEELVRRAAVALRVAKKHGGSQTTHFESPMEAIIEESRLRYVELAEAIAGGQLALVYQPTFDLGGRRSVGAEALVRWDHPVRGRLSPAEFVDFAERNGLMGALSRWVFGQVVRDLSGDGVKLPEDFRVYFNLGAQMLSDVPFIAHVKAVLRDSPRVAGQLGVEVTETAAMENVERSMNTIELFRRWGLFVAIDDFGTGHSSLAYLKQLRVDVVKIDRSFVMGLPDDERDTALTDMLLRVTDRFGFLTIAEGIETEAQADWLYQHGCRFGQGYLVARPASFDELLRRLAGEQSDDVIAV